MILLGNDGKENFWKDNWLNPTPLKDLVPGLYRIATRKIERCGKLAMHGRKWIADLRKKINVHLVVDFVKIFNMLHQITLSPDMTDDIT